MLFEDDESEEEEEHQQQPVARTVVHRAQHQHRGPAPPAPVAASAAASAAAAAAAVATRAVEMRSAAASGSPAVDPQSQAAATKSKNPFMEHKKQLAKKQRIADEETARIYDEFVASFQSEQGPNVGTGFVHSGVVNDATNSAQGDTQRGMKYVPSFLPPSSHSDVARTSVGAGAQASVFARDDGRRGKTKEMDILLEEMKQAQQNPEHYQGVGRLNPKISRDEAAEYRRSGSIPPAGPTGSLCFRGPAHSLSQRKTRSGLARRIRHRTRA